MNNDTNLEILKKVAIVIIAFYFGIQFLFGVLLLQWELTGTGLKALVIVQSVLPAIFILTWASRKGLLNSEILPFKVLDSLMNVPLVLLFTVGFFLLSEGLGNAILTLLPEEIYFDLEKEIYIPSYNIINIENITDLLIIGVGIGVLLPILTELIFRGLALHAFRPGVGINRASVFSAALWAFLHMNPVDFLTLLIMGIILAYITYRTGSLIIPIGVHVIFSLTELIYLNNFEFSELMELPELYISVIVILLSIIFIVAGVRLTDYIYSDSNKNSTITGV